MMNISLYTTVCNPVLDKLTCTSYFKTSVEVSALLVRVFQVWLEFRWKIDDSMGVQVSFLQKCYGLNNVHCTCGLNEAEVTRRLWRKAYLNMNLWLLPSFREILTTADHEPNCPSSHILHIDLCFPAARSAVCNSAILYITITKWLTGGHLEACVFVVAVSASVCNSKDNMKGEQWSE